MKQVAAATAIGALLAAACLLRAQQSLAGLFGKGDTGAQALRATPSPFRLAEFTRQAIPETLPKLTLKRA